MHFHGTLEVFHGVGNDLDETLCPSNGDWREPRPIAAVGNNPVGTTPVR